MNILHICKKYPNALGGDAVVVANLQKCQEAAGHKVSIVTSNCEDILRGPAIYKYGLKDTPARLDRITLRRLISLCMLFFYMFVILRKVRPDVIHTHSVDMAFFASFAARWYGIPLIHTFHIVTFYDQEQSVVRRKSELWLAKHAKPHVATAPNAFDVQQLQAFGLTQTQLLPNGVDVAFWRASRRAKSDDTCTFFAMGRLETQKGYEYLIQAAGMLAKLQPNRFTLIIAGEGSQRMALAKQIKKLELENTVFLVGQKTPDELRELLHRADVAVFSSLYETTPLTLLEAWASATPVIATPVGILRDAPNDFPAAHVVPPRDEQALMLAMHHLITREDIRLQSAKKGRQEAQKYAWPVIAHTAEALYRSAR